MKIELLELPDGSFVQSRGLLRGHKNRVEPYTAASDAAWSKTQLAEWRLDSGFKGIVMSDGWVVYREYANRLRCWAHLIRKARGLSESSKITRLFPRAIKRLGCDHTADS